MSLTDRQLGAAMSLSPRIVCAASPGSGKTSTLVARIGYLVESGVDPGSIVIISFTSAAARELSSRLRVNHPTARFRHVGTLHSFCLRLLNWKGDLIGLRLPVAPLSEEDSKSFRLLAVSEMNYRGTAKEFDAAMADRKWPLPLTPAQLAVKEYERTQAQCGVIDFDSVLVFGLKLLQLQIMRLIGGEFHVSYLMVDEFQDSSDIDFAIYEALGTENRFYCGDPDQNLFSFRGANVQNIIDASKISEVHLLEDNFRCAESICDRAQALIEFNAGRIDKRTVSKTGRIGRVEIAEHPNIGSEIKAIYDEIKNHDCAVIVRHNTEVAMIRNVLAGLGVPIRSPKFVQDDPEWTKARKFVSMMANPSNNRIASMVIASLQGDKAANKAYLDATLKGTRLSAQFIPPGVEVGLERVVGALVLAGFPHPVIDRVEAMIVGLDFGEPIQALVDRMSEPKPDEFTEGVEVCTIHAAKGREWWTVFLPCFNDSLFPGKKRGSALEEERRGAFVAITRAKENVFISYSRTLVDSYTGERSEGLPSRFIQEMMQK